MSKVFSISEIVASKEIGRETYEIHASAESTYDESKSKLTIELDSFLHPADATSHAAPIRPDWLPRHDTIRETVSQEEAHSETKEIFHNRVGKVRQSIPHSLTLASLLKS